MHKKMMAISIVLILLLVGLSSFTIAEPTPKEIGEKCLTPPVWYTVLFGRISNPTYEDGYLTFWAISVKAVARDIVSGGGPEFYFFKFQHVTVYAEYAEYIHAPFFIIGRFKGKPHTT